MPLVRAIARDAVKNNNRFSALVLGVVKSQPFQMNTKVAGDRRRRTASATTAKSKGSQLNHVSSRRGTFRGGRS